ncbi:unnamed protein product (macronuclear) [Paramecium tetraurelia]|uniref:Phorbol-ester/DAG-type domain-containing protein n=1 Tax=Paramecium tetraurelia TaxID=5888 RepID=A0E9N6_PARTE|nr:uncharacterized protein GSPATT00024734001 [Paramecium tetraurelia]CAK92003.1 unnamed protein product [Paramecium tetraurelia]|eukprot:XP_001459400.1 hypothetical protein (macronuclear) [Paramecium tetraurelia strain d4-2]
MQNYCSLCGLPQGTLKQELFLFPVEIKTQYKNCYIEQIVLKLITFHIHQLILIDNYILFRNEKHICESCWQLIQQGFTCKKCKVYNFVQNSSIKQCNFCKSCFCLDCEAQLELFSSTQGICYGCQKQELFSYKIAYFIMILFVGLIVPCLAFNQLLSQYFDPIHQFNCCKNRFYTTLLLFILLFPFLYPYTIIQLICTGIKSIIRNCR